ncbi:hypothetical protein BJX64DRAFT_257103 [Aspergillus heterothallicus]
MSSLFAEAGTPCPRRSKSSTFRDSSGTGSDSFGLWDDSLGNYDETQNIDFTTEIIASTLTGTKPKRRTKDSTSFIIHSDYDEKPLAVKQKREIKPALSTVNRKTSLLAQPAQRFRPRVSFAPSPVKHSEQRDGVDPMKRNTRPSVHKNNELLRRISAEGKSELGKDNLKKDVRRNTVYIPPEDTTVASAFMGLFSPLKPGNLNHAQEDREINSLESQIAKKRQAKHGLALSPGRVPLQRSSRILQETSDSIDIPGRNGGKENVPPGMVQIGLKGKKVQAAKCSEDIIDVMSALKLTDNKSVDILVSAHTVSKPLAPKKVNVALQKTTNSLVTLKPRGRGGVEAKNQSNAGAKGTVKMSSTLSDPLKSSRTGMELSTSRSSLKQIENEYPLVSQGITNPTMYDDNWLSHQEVILTQLINGLFDGTKGIPQTANTANLRRELLILYQSPTFTELHKRLQASLLYGALSIPKDALAKNSRLRNDLGLKRKFIDIWLKTYDSNALKAALETVTGRIIPASKPSLNSLSVSKVSSSGDRILQKRLEKFLNAFLVQNQDMAQETTEHNAKDSESLGNAYRRTILRSIMLVILLDKARLGAQTSLPRCLFLASSPYKSSSAVLHALTRVLLPSCGDISKALGQLDCQVSHQQYPLEEYEYEASNLAVDLRDGIRLTRIIELLLYPSASCRQSLSSDKAPLELSLSRNSTEDFRWPLSRHLKFPCLSRTVKVFNVRLGLDALASNKEGRQFINNIRAEDIVDGHREKTIALLWALVSKWGLSGLVNLDDLRNEIQLLKRRAMILGSESSTNDSGVKEHSDSDEAAVLLEQWASLVAQLQTQNPGDAANLEDSRVYECILDEYERYMLGQNELYLSMESKAPLESRLRALGCSAQFIHLVSPKFTSHILNTNSNTGALAFLCSRLLPFTKRARAAIVLQNTWRRVLHDREEKRRIIARDIARRCAAVVQTRDRILWAKTVILHWWRMNKSKRPRKMATRTKRVTLGRKSIVSKQMTATTTKIPLRRGR